MKAIRTILTLFILLITFTSCKRWQLPDADNQYLTVLKRDGNLLKTKVRLGSEIRVDATNQDTLTSSVSGGKATITRTTLKGVTIPAKTKGKIIDEDIDFILTIGEDSGIYMDGKSVKVDQEFLTMINKLQQFYEKFKSKWSKVLAMRKKTKPLE